MSGARSSSLVLILSKRYGGMVVTSAINEGDPFGFVGAVEFGPASGAEVLDGPEFVEYSEEEGGDDEFVEVAS